MKCHNCPAKADPLLEGFCKLCDMLLSAQPPGCVTDATFMAGVGMGKQFEQTQGQGDFYAAEAKKRGVSTTGKVYLSSLASYAGDPRAWVSDRSDILKVAQERGYTVQGDVNYKPAVNRDPKPSIDVAPDLIEAGVQEVMTNRPGLIEKPQQLNDLREQVRNRIKPNWAK